MRTGAITIILLLAGTLTMMFIMANQGQTLRNKRSARLGIVSLELAYDSSQTNEIIREWSIPDEDGTEVAVAIRNTKLDFIFIFFYSLFLFFAAKAINKKFGGWFGRQGKWISKAALVAGGMDVLENCGMLMTLTGKGSDTVAMATAICSSIKWMLVMIAVFYVLTGGVAALRRRIPT